MSFEILGKTWFYHAKSDGKSKQRCLSDVVPDIFTHSKKQLVSMWIPQEGKKDLILFTWFESKEDMVTWIKDISPSQRVQFECIRTLAGSCKLVFDLDIKGKKTILEADKVRNMFIDHLLDYFEKKFKVILSLSTDVLIYTSHCEEKEKFSYHLVIDNFCFKNYRVVGIVAHDILDKCPRKLQKYVEDNSFDRSIYPVNETYSFRQLRFYGCRKPNTNRIKTLCDTWEFFGDTVVHRYSNGDSKNFDNNFYHSLISFTDYCTLLNAEKMEKKKEKKLIKFQETSEILDSELEQILNKCEEKYENEWTYEVRSVEGNLIILNRLAPSLCPVCGDDKLHESENPLLYILGNRVYFYCRRSEKSEIACRIEREEVEEMVDEEKKSPVKKKKKISMPRPVEHEEIIFDREIPISGTSNKDKIKEVLKSSGNLKESKTSEKKIKKILSKKSIVSTTDKKRQILNHVLSK